MHVFLIHGAFLWFFIAVQINLPEEMRLFVFAPVYSTQSQILTQENIGRRLCAASLSGITQWTSAITGSLFLIRH